MINDVNWDGWDDADFDKDELIEDGVEFEALERKLKIAKDGDMWFIDYDNDGLGEAQCPDHVGIYFTRIQNGETVGRLIEANERTYDVVRTTDDKIDPDLEPDPQKSFYWNGRDKKSIFCGLRRRSQ